MAIVLAMRQPDLVASLVLAEGNVGVLTAGGAAATVAGQSDQAAYVADGHAASVERLRQQPWDVSTESVRGDWQIASPVALDRSARALLDAERLGVREHLLEMTIPGRISSGRARIGQLKSSRPCAPRANASSRCRT